MASHRRLHQPTSDLIGFWRRSDALQLRPQHERQQGHSRGSARIAMAF
jgi:hypothetical protein